MPDFSTVATIVLMASTTYLSRILGYAMLRNRPLSPRMAAVMENVPGCVLISVIAPAFVSTRPADLLALGITIVAATRLSILPTVAIGVVSAGVLRHLLG
ncbi:AzlD family protein [Burkholderia multivorans]|uniref:AzlD family protein n=1 Tax=Burkholderia multivorans TaxID=87883 RepID=UPI001C21C46B|nr:AzlD family protein [Burkholderia multivorans]MBU9404968.1 AzlD family protein [Burkholderia multivorans]